MAHTTISQPHPDSPFGKPYGVETHTGHSIRPTPEWFVTEQEAWDYLDQCLDYGIQCRLIGADFHGAATVGTVADAKYGCSGFCDGD